MPPVIDRDKCTGCGKCDWNCPGDIIHMSGETGLAVVRYPGECWHCGACRLDCPVDAITIRMSLDIL